jgi:hypothetical protein
MSVLETALRRGGLASVYAELCPNAESLSLSRIQSAARTPPRSEVDWLVAAVDRDELESSIATARSLWSKST